MIFCSSQFTEMILLVSHLVSCDQFTSVIGNNKVKKNFLLHLKYLGSEITSVNTIGILSVKWSIG